MPASPSVWVNHFPPKLLPQSILFTVWSESSDSISGFTAEYTGKIPIAGIHTIYFPGGAFDLRGYYDTSKSVQLCKTGGIPKSYTIY